MSALSTIDRSRNIPTLDGWRAIAVLIVLTCHSADELSHLSVQVFGRALTATQLDGVRAFGLLGVQIFFALSGFLITSRLIDEERQHGRASLRNFYVRRFFRILPAAVGVLVVLGALSILGIIPITAGRWWSSLLFFSNYSPAKSTWYLGHFWSLAVEEHFYLVWPLVFISFTAPTARLRIVIALTVILTLWRAVAFKYGITYTEPAVFWGRTDIVADNLLFGVACALVVKEWPQSLISNPILANAIVSAILLIAIVLITVPGASGWKTDMVLRSVKAAAIPILILGTILRAKAGGRTLLEWRFMKWLGRMSYSLYLWQQLFLVWNEWRIPAFAPVQQLPVSLGCALILAYCSYRWLERPMIEFGHRFLVPTRAETHPPLRL